MKTKITKTKIVQKFRSVNCQFTSYLSSLDLTGGIDEIWIDFFISI